jgi:hypothetical protein
VGIPRLARVLGARRALALVSVPLVAGGALVATSAPARAGATGSQVFEVSFSQGAEQVDCRFTLAVENADYTDAQGTHSNVGWVSFDVTRTNSGDPLDCQRVLPGAYLAVFWRTPDEGGGEGSGNASVAFGSTLPAHYERQVQPVATNRPAFEMNVEPRRVS